MTDSFPFAEIIKSSLSFCVFAKIAYGKLYEIDLKSVVINAFSEKMYGSIKFFIFERASESS